MANDTYQIKIGGGVKNEVFASLGKLDAKVLGVGKNLVSNLALPLTSVFSGTAIASFIAGSARAADALGDLREETGLTIQMLGGLKLTAAIKGLGEIDVPMRRFASAVREAQVEGTKFNDLFKKMGVDPMQDLDTVLFDVSDKFASWEDGINKLGIAEDLFGTKQAKFIQLLNMGADGLRENVTEFTRTHPAVGEASEAVDKYNEQLEKLKSNLEGVAQEVVTGFEPAITKLTKAASSLVDLYRNNPWLQGPLGAYLMSPSHVPVGAENAGGNVSTVQNRPDAPNTSADPKKAIRGSVEAQREKVDLLIQENRLFSENSAARPFKDTPQYLESLDKEIALIKLRESIVLDSSMFEGDSAYRRMLIEDGNALNELQDKRMDFLREYERAEAAHQQKIIRLYQERGAVVADMFANMTMALGTFIGEGSVAYKAFATAQAVASTAVGAVGAFSQASLTFPPPFGQIIGGIAAGTVVAAGAAQIAKINGAFMEGGYTGDLGTSQVAGVVHGREFVIPANRVSEFGVDFFEGIRTGEIKPAEAAAASGGGVGSTNVNMAMVNNRNQMREFMASEGAKIIVDYMDRRRR
jgi:hypothetical protein